MLIIMLVRKKKTNVFMLSCLLLIKLNVLQLDPANLNSPLFQLAATLNNFSFLLQVGNGRIQLHSLRYHFIMLPFHHFTVNWLASICIHSFTNRSFLYVTNQTCDIDLSLFFLNKIRGSVWKGAGGHRSGLGVASNILT